MNIFKMAVKGAKKGAKAFVEKSPVLLAGAAIAGVASVAVVAAKAGPRIKDIKDRRKKEMDEIETKEEKKEISNEEAKKLRKEANIKYGKEFAIELIPIILTAGLTIACIIGLNSVHLKKQAALAAVASMADTQSEEFLKKAREIIGEEKVEEIKDAVFKDKVSKDCLGDGLEQNPDRMECKAGHYPMYDPTANHYISGNRDVADNIELWIENQVKCSFDNKVSLEELHDHLDEPVLTKDSELGYTAKDFERGKKVTIRLRAGETPQGRLIYRMRFDPEPHQI